MRRRTKNKNRRRGSSGAGTPAQLLGDQLQLRVEPGRISPAARAVYGVERYTDPLQSGTPRQMLPKYGLTLNGSTEYATAAFSVPASIWVSFWFKAASAGAGSDGVIGNYRSTTNQRSWLVQVEGTTGHLQCFQSSDGTAIAYAEYSTNICDNDWHHIAANFGSGAAVPPIFIDGNRVSTIDVGSQTGPLNDDYSTLEIGRYNLDNSLACACQLDDIRIYNTALTDSQIADLAAIAPGSQRGANVGSPLIHYKCEDPVTSATLRNSGSLSGADATITTAAIATVRGTASPVYSFANSVGGSQAWCSDGSDDYLDTQLTLDSATAFTVWRRMRYLSTDGYDVDGFQVSGNNRIELGRGNGTNIIRYSYGRNGTDDGTATIANGQAGTTSITSDAAGNYSVRINNAEVNSGTTSGFTSISNASQPFLIGATGAAGVDYFHSHAEYYEYLIADRVLTDDELTWLETGGQTGTAIDFEDDANILLYTDFSQQTETQIVNQANPNLPILKASGSAAGELTMVPRSESDTTKDVDQAEYSYRTAVKLDTVNTSDIDLGSQLIPSSGDFSFSLDFMVPSSPSIDDGLLSQYASGQAGRFWLSVDTNEQLTLFCNGSSNLLIQSGNNAITLGKWHNAEVSRVGNVFTLSLDGVVIGTQTVDVTPYATNTRLLSSEQTGYFPVGTQVSNLTINGNQYLTTPNETISGATLTNTSYVNVVRGKPGTIQHTGIAPRDMPLSVPCVIGDGVGDYVSVPNFYSVDAQSDSIDVTLWVDSNNKVAAQQVLAFGNSAVSNSSLRIQKDNVTSGAIRLYMQASNGTIRLDAHSTTVVFDGSPHKIRMVIDDGNYSLYIDDSLDMSGTYTKSATTEVDTLTYLARDSNSSVSGYAVAKLSQVTVTQAGTLFCNHPLTEGSGDVAHDVSGNGNHGTINGTLANIWANTTSTPGSGTLVADGYSVGTWFDGATDYLNRGARLTSGAIGQLSVQLEFFRDSSSGAEVLVCEYAPSNLVWGLYLNNNDTLAFFVSTDGTTAVTSTTDDVVAPAGERHSVSVVYDAGTLTIKVDGDEKAFTSGGTIPASLSSTTGGHFAIGAYSNGATKFGGTISHLKVEDAAWTPSEESAMLAAGKASEVKAIRPNAWYFPDAKTETLQGLPALTVNGAPEQRVIPAGTGLPPISYGPGLLPPNCSLDLYCNEDDAPFSQGLAALLTDGDYDFDDGGPEGDSLFRKTDNSNGEEIAVIKPAATGAELTILEAWDSD